MAKVDHITVTVDVKTGPVLRAMMSALHDSEIANQEGNMGGNTGERADQFITDDGAPVLYDHEGFIAVCHWCKKPATGSRPADLSAPGGLPWEFSCSDHVLASTTKTHNRRGGSDV